MLSEEVIGRDDHEKREIGVVETLIVVEKWNFGVVAPPSNNFDDRQSVVVVDCFVGENCYH